MIARSGMRHRSSVVVVRLLLQYSTIDVMDAGIWVKICGEKTSTGALSKLAASQKFTAGFLARAYCAEQNADR